MCTIQLTEKDLLVFNEIQKQISEFSSVNQKSTLIPLKVIATKIAATVEDVMASIVALEAAQKIRRYGRPETIQVRNVQGETTAEICLKLGVPQTAAERARAFRNNQKALGRRSVLFWLTPEEDQKLKSTLAEIRANPDPAF